MKTQHDSETPAEGRQVFTACAFLWHEFDGVKKVFLAKRAETKRFLPGMWELPGGHVDYGEDLRDGLAREVLEEFGMRIEVGDVVDVFTYLNEVKKSHSVEVIYFAQFTDPLENIRPNPADHSAYGWFAVDELNALFAAQKTPNDPDHLAICTGFAKLTSAA